jgi:hypothetical protein
MFALVTRCYAKQGDLRTTDCNSIATPVTLRHQAKPLSQQRYFRWALAFWASAL